MARKIIPYPCDYKVTASVRRARRGGNVFVIILCIIVAALLGAGTYFALTNERQALKTIGSLCSRTYAINPTEQPKLPEGQNGAVVETDPTAVPEPTAAPATLAPTATPEPTAEPTEQPTKAPRASATPSVPAMTAAPNPDPSYEERMAKPFAQNTLQSLPDIVEACTPGVVGVLNYQPVSLGRDLQIVGSGSGFVITEDGYIVTNQHVVDEARRVTVILSDGEEVEATLIGSDVMSDVAVLKIEKQGLTPLPIGNSESIRVGEYVLAIGNPLSTEELYGSVTFGIISAKSRNINIDGFTNELMQTDAAINPGNSGGPLINMYGEVIGVTNAKYFSAGYDEYGNELHTEGIGFALPMNKVMTIVDALIRNGSVPRPGIGVTIGVRTDAMALSENKPAGVFIDSVTPNGPADIAGLKVDDILLALDGVVMTQDEFVQTIRGKKIGDSITFTVLRDGETLEIVVTVGDLNQIH